MAVLDKDVFWFIKAYNFMKNGFLPNEGGWMNQPNKLCEAFDFIDVEVSRESESERKKALNDRH